jgi:hypothetical protein
MLSEAKHPLARAPIFREIHSCRKMAGDVLAQEIISPPNSLRPRFASCSKDRGQRVGGAGNVPIQTPIHLTGGNPRAGGVEASAFEREAREAREADDCLQIHVLMDPVNAAARIPWRAAARRRAKAYRISDRKRPGGERRPFSCSLPLSAHPNLGGRRSRNACTPSRWSGLADQAA